MFSFLDQNSHATKMYEHYESRNQNIFQKIGFIRLLIAGSGDLLFTFLKNGSLGGVSVCAA